MTGTFYGVSVGPGDPELLTLQAVRLLRQCPVLAAPQTASGQMLALDIARRALGSELDGKTILPLQFAMSRDAAVLRASHETAASAVRPFLDAGQDVAMLNLGDVSIYATFGYLQEILQAQGYATAMAAGVPSFCAAAARLNQPLTGGMDAPLTIAPGSRADEVLDAPGTKVLMKTGRQLPALLNTLDLPFRTVRCGRSEHCAVRVMDMADHGVAGITCTVVSPRDTYHLTIPAPGEHMAYSAAIAVAVGEELGLSTEEITRGAASYEPAGSRMRVLRLRDGRLVLDDCYNANPQSVTAALEILAKTECGRKVAVLGDMGELGDLTDQAHYNMGALAAMLGIELPESVADFVAQNVTANVRQLEGTINKILAYKDLLGNDTDEETVTRAIQDMLRRSNEYVPTPEAILEYISKYYSLDESVIRGQQRVRDAVSARQIAMYLIRSMTNLSLDEIGKVFDNRDHSTVLYSIQQIEKKMKKDAAFAEMVKEIKTNINSKR